MLLSNKGLHNFTYPRTDAVAIMIAIDETGDKVLLGRGVRQPQRRLVIKSLIFYCRKNFLEIFTRLWLALLNQARLLKMLYPEKCGKKLEFAFGMLSTTLASHGSALCQGQFPIISKFYHSPFRPTSWSDFTPGRIPQNLYAQI